MWPTWSSPVSKDSALINMESGTNTTSKRDANPENSSGFYKMSNLKEKRELTENELNELSKREVSEEHKLSKRALEYR
ncbi:5002_t:CDS:1, partial [Cetraspora pellucida]